MRCSTGSGTGCNDWILFLPAEQFPHSCAPPIAKNVSMPTNIWPAGHPARSEEPFSRISGEPAPQVRSESGQNSKFIEPRSGGAATYGVHKYGDQ